jgi:hypothetical protein
MDHPGLQADEMAAKLAGEVGKPLSAGWVRKRLHLARRRLAEWLIEQVRQSLRQPTDQAVQEELAELGLLESGRRAWQDRSPEE